MPYVSIGRIQKAIESLQRFHAFFGVTFLSMKESGVSTGTPIPWGQRQENELLNKYYRPLGAPPNKPFFVPYKAPEAEHGLWKNPKYSGGTLQRARTSDRFKPAFDHPTPEEWAFVDDYLSILASLLPQEPTGTVRLPVFDLAAWLYRDRDLPATLAEVAGLLREEFSLSQQEYEALFDASPEDEKQFFFSEVYDRDELIQLMQGVPEAPSLTSRTEEELIAAIEAWVRDEELLSLPDGFVRAFYSAAKAQRFVVLSGRPGTGKTAFARAFANALQELFPNAVSVVQVAVAQEFTEADVIGYEKIAGDLAATELTRALFLSGRPRDIYIIILDEMNLAHVDFYLARLLPAIESDAPVELPGTAGQVPMPADAYVVGTINSYLEESTRLPLSAPVKRRANVVDMPNVLARIVKDGDQHAFASTTTNLLKQTERRIRKRGDDGVASILDGFRLADLSDALKDDSPVRKGEFVDALWSICVACATESVSGITLGVLQDVLEYVAMSPDDVMTSLDRQVAQKLAPQLGGPAAVVRAVMAELAGLESNGHLFPESRRVLQDMLETEEPGSGIVAFLY